LTSMLKDRDGRMLALHLAAAESKTDAVHLLLVHNANECRINGWIVLNESIRGKCSA